MAVENIDALSDGVIERRALEVLERADFMYREPPTDGEHLIKADYRAVYNFLVGSNVLDRRGNIHKQFLEEGTDGEICARLAMGRMLRKLANSPMDAELASILILLAGHFDGKMGYQTVPRTGSHKWPVVELFAERRLKFDDLPTESLREIGLAWIKRVWSQVRSTF